MGAVRRSKWSQNNVQNVQKTDEKRQGGGDTQKREAAERQKKENQRMNNDEATITIMLRG